MRYNYWFSSYKATEFYLGLSSVLSTDFASA